METSGNLERLKSGVKVAQQIARFYRSSDGRGEDPAVFAPVVAGQEPFLLLPLAMVFQGAHGECRKRKHAKALLRFGRSLQQQSFSLDALHRLGDGEHGVVQVHGGLFKSQSFTAAQAERQRHRIESLKSVALYRTQESACTRGGERLASRRDALPRRLGELGNIASN